MQTNVTPSASLPVVRPATNTSRPWLMLISRSVLFLVFQALIAVIAAVAGGMSLPDAWDESSRWWTFMAFFTNLVSLYALIRLFRAEGKRYFEVIRFSRETWKADLLWFILATAIAMPIVGAPREPLAIMIFGDVTTATNMMFRPLPMWAFILSFLFPLTIWFAELPTYFAYVMPRLEAQFQNGWAAWLLTSIFLAAQHIFLPLILDGGYLLWRLGMFLPFALFTGFVIKLRPSLLPYFLIVHVLLDVSTVLVYLMI